MNQAHTHRFHPSDFDPPKRISGLAVFLVVVGMCAATMVGFVAGIEFQTAIYEAAKAIPKPRPTVQRHDPFGPYCANEQGRREFLQMCSVRKRMTGVTAGR